MPRFTLLVALSAAMLQLQPDADPEIHLIPAGYAGPVMIVFSAVNGEPLDIEDGARRYRIPSSGVLFTQIPPNEGMGPVREYFLVAPNGDRFQIHDKVSNLDDTPANRANPEIEIFNPSGGYIQGPCDIRYAQYFVGTRAQFLDYPEGGRGRIIKYVQDTFRCP